MSSLTDGTIGELLGQLYVQKHFKPEAKARMDEMIANIKAVFRDRLATLDWMTDATRQKALAKFDRFDYNGDGSLTKKEVRLGVKESGVKGITDRAVDFGATDVPLPQAELDRILQDGQIYSADPARAARLRRRGPVAGAHPWPDSGADVSGQLRRRAGRCALRREP